MIETCKTCSKCDKLKPLSDFSKRTDRENRYRNICKECNNTRRRNYEKGNPELVAKWNKQKAKRIENDPVRFHQRRMSRLNSHRKRKFNLSYEEYQVMSDQQGGVCAICGKPEITKDQNGKVRSLAIDHDHATGKVRGLLCTRCNVGLVLIEHEDLKKAAEAYLAR
jgi:hypothetical protein